MNSQMKGLVLSLGLMQVARKVPTDRPDVLFIIRCTYILSQLLQVALFYWTSLKIKAKNDTTVLKYQEPPKGFGQGAEPGAPVTTTVRDYDLKEVSKNTPSMLIGIAIMAVMHLKFGYTQPLLIQSVMPLKSLYENPIIRIHILGYPATGDLARPFKAPPGLMSALNEANQASNGSIKRAEDENTPKITEIKDDVKQEKKKDL